MSPEPEELRQKRHASVSKCGAAGIIRGAVLATTRRGHRDAARVVVGGGVVVARFLRYNLTTLGLLRVLATNVSNFSRSA